MVSAWGTLAFLVALSSFVPFITCPGPETSETTSTSTTDASGTTSTVTTTVDSGAQQTQRRRCVDLYILRPIRWFVEGPLQMVWNTMAKVKDSLASLYGISAPKPNVVDNKNV